MEPIIQNYPIVIVAIALFILVAIILYLINRPRERYIKVDSLFTPAELKFYKLLEETIDDYKIFGKVRVADIIRVDSKKAKGKYLKFFNRISRKHVDFLICEPQSLEPLVAIELDDSSHELKEREERDIFLDRAFKMAGIPLLRFKVRSSYDKIEVRQRIYDAINKG